MMVEYVVFVTMVILGMVFIDKVVKTIRNHVLKINNHVHEASVHEPIIGIDVHDRSFVKDMQKGVI